MESELPWVSDLPGDTTLKGLCLTFSLFSGQARRGGCLPHQEGGGAMALLWSIPRYLLVLIVFGIPFVLVGFIALVFSSSIVAWFREGSARVRRHFYCESKQMEVDVDFLPRVFSPAPRDVKHCSAFPKGPITCGKSCLPS